jgi:Zn-dependent protease with chaperone function
MTLLVSWFWQGLLVAAGAGLLLRLLPRVNAATRHVIWWGALGGVIVLGIVHLVGAVVAPGPIVLGTAGLGVDSRAAFVSLPAAPDWLLTLAFSVWAVAALHGWLRILRGVRHVAGLRRQAVPLDPDRAARFARWTAGRFRRPAPVYVTQLPVGACAIGFRRPAILVSQRLLDTLDDEGLDQVLLHEQAHLDRHDDWLRALQSLVTSAAVIHPAVHVIARHIDLEREAACDDRVVTATGGAGEYAACLTNAAGAIAPAAVAAVSALGGASSGGTLRVRIARLLDPRPDRGRRVVRPVVAAAAASISALLVAAPLMPSLVVFVERAAPPADFALVEARPTVAAAPAGTARAGEAVARELPPAAAPPRARAAVVVRDAVAGDLHAEPQAVSAAQAPEPAAPPPTADPLAAGAHEIPHETLGASTLPVADVPPLQQAAGPVTTRSRPASPEASFLGDMSSFGKTTATTAWKAGLSVAGTFTRAGKAIGRFF